MAEIQELGPLPIIESRFERLNAEKKKPKEEYASNVTTGNYNLRSNISGSGVSLAETENKVQENEKKSDNNVDYGELAKKLGTLLDNENLELEFSKDKETEKMILKIIDIESDEVVRQFPPEVSLKIARIVANSVIGGAVTNAKV